MLEGHTQGAETPEVEEEEGCIFPPHILKRGVEKQLTAEYILSYFRDWLFEEHGTAQKELRYKRDERNQLAPIVEAVGHLERASDLVKQYQQLCQEVEALEAEYGALESHQMVAFEAYELDLTDPATLFLFQKCMAEAKPEEWFIRGEA